MIPIEISKSILYCNNATSSLPQLSRLILSFGRVLSVIYNIHTRQKTVSHVAGSGSACVPVNNIEEERERYVKRSSIDLSIIRRQL